MFVRPLVLSSTQLRASASMLSVGHSMVRFSFKINSMELYFFTGKGKKENKKVDT